MTELDGCKSEVTAAGEAMQHRGESTLPALFLQSLRHIGVAFARMNHQRQAGFACRLTRVEIVTRRPMPAARARSTTASSSAAKSGKSRWQWLSTSMDQVFSSVSTKRGKTPTGAGNAASA